VTNHYVIQANIKFSHFLLLILMIRSVLRLFISCCCVWFSKIAVLPNLI